MNNHKNLSDMLDGYIQGIARDSTLADPEAALCLAFANGALVTLQLLRDGKPRRALEREALGLVEKWTNPS